jgi:hypothetical protein
VPPTSGIPSAVRGAPTSLTARPAGTSSLTAKRRQ